MQFEEDDRSATAKAMDWVSRIMTLGFVVVIPTGLGYWLDGVLGCSPWMVILGLFAGLVSAGYLLWKLVARMEAMQLEATQLGEQANEGNGSGAVEQSSEDGPAGND